MSFQSFDSPAWNLWLFCVNLQSSGNEQPNPRFAEMFIAAKGVFGEYKQHPQIVAKGT